MNLEELARQAGYSVSPMCGIAFPQHGAEDETELLAEAQARFPQVFGRLPQAVRLKTPNVGVEPVTPATEER